MFIVESRQRFSTVREAYDVAADLVLTYDFGLRHEIETAGGAAFNIDRLIDPAVMQENNQLLYSFFQKWNIDADGADMFEHEGVPFGFALRLEFWSDFVFYVRACVCLERVLESSCERLYVGTSSGVIEAILAERGIAFSPVPQTGAGVEYFFPIHSWMDANIRHTGLKAAVLSLASYFLGKTRNIADRVSRARRRPAIFLQEYHPTALIARWLRADRRVRVVVAGPTRAHPLTRVVPLPRRSARHRRRADALLRAFRARRSAAMVLSTGTDISIGVYGIIERRVDPQLADVVRTLEGAVRQLDRDPFHAVVLIANIGETVTVVDCACRARGIPSYLIINGLMAAAFGDESKYATTINSYSPSIRDHYFHGMNNVVCLGDPRMDAYLPMPRRSIDPDRFTVTIGASGYNPTDLNSYVAVEFDFLSGVLTAIERVKRTCPGTRVIIKVRANGYRAQYVAFAQEYFPDLVDEIVDAEPMPSLLDRTDFYISIYSQTLFEASCLGIPVLYYRIGDYYKYPPFDGQSELVTADTVDEVETALKNARRGHACFDAFLDRSVMAKYVGPLDGRNLERNLGYIYDLIQRPMAATDA